MIKISNISYETKLFNNNTINVINIYTKDNKDELLSFSIDEKDYLNCDIHINDEIIYNVGVRIKGGSTRMIFNDLYKESQKYSLKIKLDEYIDGQSYYGLDGIELNGQVHDKTFMRDYFAYDMMRFMGVPAPLVSFADVYINDEYWGFYVCIENVKDSFLKRNFGDDYGELYKPSNALANDKNTSMGNDLVYRGDNEELYKNIFNLAKTDIDEEDRIRLINSIKKINNGDVKGYVDIDNIINYFAVNIFVGAPDNYFIERPHNYYLYEKYGVLRIIPWDYDFAFFHVGNMDYNYFSEKTFMPIDNPINKSFNYSIDERPIWKIVVENENYRNLYHSKIDMLITDYFDSGYFINEYNKILDLIKDNIIKDYNKNCSIYDDKSLNDIFKRVDLLKEICLFRVDNVKKQLSGEISLVDNSNYSDFNLLEDYSYQKYSDVVYNKNSNKYFSFS